MPPPDSSDAPPPDSAAKFVTPGVYIDEIQFRARAITGVCTSTTAFVGPAVSGPAGTASKLITAYGEFKEVYGDSFHIEFGVPAPEPVTNYLALAVKAFFENGGSRLYISRVAAADGTNSAFPTAEDYARALGALDELREVAIVAAPGGSIAGTMGIASVVPVHAALLDHVDRQVYRFAVLDPPQGCTLDEVQALRAQLDSKNAALYYAWITIADPSFDPKAAAQMNVPPSGAVCGIYARTDASQGVAKAPANQQIVGARGFERTITNAEQEILNPLGINCLRTFPGRGNLVWGARTVSSDPQWKYINVRRYFAYLEHTIAQGTQWVVFEPNNDQLWMAIRRTVSSFLLNEWKSGALLGSKSDDAYFVKCDQTTMTQDDLDNGRLICLIGVAPIKPAEFVIFRICQFTASAS